MTPLLGVEAMPPVVVALLSASIGCSVLAQVLMKVGMSDPGVQAALAAGPAPRGIVTALVHPAVAGGIALYGVGAVLWLLVLARIDLSKAYPFMAVGLCLTVLLGHLVLGEPLGTARLVGTLVVVAGISLIAGS